MSAFHILTFNLSNYSNVISDSVSHFQEVATSLLNEASIFFKSSSDSKDATTCDIVDEKLLLRSKEFLNGDILSSKVALSEFLKESVKSQDAFEGMYFCVV